MSSDERSITKILDDGGPFVIWEKEKKGTFRRGMILDTWVCDNPECRSVHLQAVAIDERFKKSRHEKDHKSASERDENHRQRNRKIKHLKQITSD